MIILENVYLITGTYSCSCKPHVAGVLEPFDWKTSGFLIE